jgi:hypothetical protein
MNGNKALVANFAAVRQLSVLIQGAGEVQLDRSDGRYPHGASASLVAVPAPGWRFAAWTQDLQSGAASATLTMNSDRAVLARFEHPKENWRAAHFNASELANPAVSGDLAAPGPHGIPNLLSYLAGRGPRDPAPLADGPEIRGESLFYRFTRNTGAVGSALVAEISSDLSTWTAAPAGRVIESRNGVETVEIAVPRAGLPRVFIRLRALTTD